MVLIYRNSVALVNRTTVQAMGILFGMHDSNIRLREARTKAGFKSARSAAQRFGWKESTYASHENGQTPVPLKDAEAYAKAFDVSAGWLLTGEGLQNKKSMDKFDKSQESETVRYRTQPRIVPSSRSREAVGPSSSDYMQESLLFTGNRDLPVFAAAAGGDGHVIIDTDPIDYMKRPAMLEHVKDAYGLVITLESMVPELWPNDTALINPRLPPTRNEVCVFYSDDGKGQRKATVKRLISFNDTEWVVKQWNPEKKFKLKRAEWTIAHRLVGKYSAR